VEVFRSHFFERKTELHQGTGEALGHVHRPRDVAKVGRKGEWVLTGEDEGRQEGEGGGDIGRGGGEIGGNSGNVFGRLRRSGIRKGVDVGHVCAGVMTCRARRGRTGGGKGSQLRGGV